MPVKFGFSDECGSYYPQRTARQMAAHPYYIRSLFIINGDDYRKLSRDFDDLKDKFGLPKEEIKWAYIWPLRESQSKGRVPHASKDYYFLKDIPYATLIEFVKEALLLLKKLQYCKTVFTITNNNSKAKFSEKDLFKMHITTILQRTQFETQKEADDLTVLFFDPLCEEKNKLLRDVYFDIKTKGDFVKDYTHIKDSLNLEYSHHSTGIQIADFLAGLMAGVMKGYGKSIEIFEEAVRPTLRFHRKILGAGICEIPTNANERAKLREHFTANFK